LVVEDRRWLCKLSSAFLGAGQELGYDLNDINGLNQTGKTLPD